MTDALIAFLNARLDETAAGAWAVHDVAKCDALLYEEDMAGAAADTPDCDCGHPARVLREVAMWRRLLLDYQMPPAAAVSIPRLPGDIPTPRELHAKELGFRLAMSAALKAKIATYPGNPVTGEPFPSLVGRV